MGTKLEKLQNLCEIANKRYALGKNDDDQVAKMFSFEKSQNEAVVVIGYDDYKAISKQEFLRLAEESTNKKTNDGVTTFNFFIGHKTYKGIIKG